MLFVNDPSLSINKSEKSSPLVKLPSTNFKLLDYIREINFVFVSDVGIIDEIKEYKKVGNLLNLQVFLDPNLKEDKIIFHTENRDKEYELFVNF